MKTWSDSSIDGSNALKEGRFTSLSDTFLLMADG
jgi:hypothetical protein